ncbi:hypothetical protein [Streptomyces spinoverrucosus]|uniref:hypothetical protein n=1 Tax=Streptomyces spinoverrucosus TaxID=284043 RepID=UPI00142EF298|nr:hypothetical protein [Streptomyces spinoverrucosus]
MIFDKDTLAYLGSQAYFVNDGARARGATSDVLFGIDAVMGCGVVDRYDDVLATTAG